MRKTILFLSACMWCIFCQAQTIERAVISSGGAFVEQGAYSLSYSIAQTATETVTSANNILTQGFQQPGDFFTGINEIKTKGQTIAVYPNPVLEDIHVNIKSDASDDFTLLIFDMMGKQVLPATSVTSNTDNVINLNGLAPGSYIIRVTDDHDTRVICFLKN